MKKSFLYLLSLILAINVTLVGCVFSPNKKDNFPPVSRNNETILQAFYWEMGEAGYPKEETDLWLFLAQKAPELSEVGFTAVWLPPANKAMGGKRDVGYATYDLWDLGEFNQKGTVRTKYGTKEELENAITALHNDGIKVYYDAVLNHRMGADSTETVKLSPYSPDKPGQTIKAWTKLAFPGRKNKYSDFQWNWQCFDGADWDESTRTSGKFLFEGKSWDYTFIWNDDYLMGADVDYENHKVQKDVTNWGNWIINEIGFDGFRLDAVKHIDYRFINQFITDVQKNSNKDVFFVGEAWIENVDDLVGYLNTVNNEDLKVFDFPLRSAFADMINGTDMRTLQNVGLVNKEGYKNRAVTFVDNHDTNRDGKDPGIYRRKYQAYAYILTREHGIPVVYWKDYYIYGMKNELDKLLEVRKYFAYGPGYEVDNNDEDVYSYVREGLEEVEGDGLVLMISDGESGEIISKRINSRQPNTTFYDYTGHVQGNIITDERGYGNFKVRKSENEGWSVWVPVIE